MAWELGTYLKSDFHDDEEFITGVYMGNGNAGTGLLEKILLSRSSGNQSSAINSLLPHL